MRTSAQRKSCFILLLMMVMLLLNSMQCMAEQKVISTSAGKLIYSSAPMDDAHHVKTKTTLNGKVIHEDAESYLIAADELAEQIKTPYGDINIFKTYLSGNACPMLYYAVTTQKSGGYFVSKTFGNCVEDGKYAKKLQGDILTLRMPNIIKVSEDIVVEVHKDKIIEKALSKRTGSKKKVNSIDNKVILGIRNILKQNVNKSLTDPNRSYKLVSLVSKLINVSVDSLGDKMFLQSPIAFRKGFYHFSGVSKFNYGDGIDIYANNSNTCIVLIKENGRSTIHSNIDLAEAEDILKAL